MPVLLLTAATITKLVKKQAALPVISKSIQTSGSDNFGLLGLGTSSSAEDLPLVKALLLVLAAALGAVLLADLALSAACEPRASTFLFASQCSKHTAL